MTSVRLLSWFGVALLVVLVVCFGRDAGITYDEQAQSTYGDYVLAWYRSGFTNDRATHYSNLYLYGGLFDLCAQWLVGFVPLDQYDTRHLLTALLATLGVVGTARMAARVGGPRAGLLAGLMLALTPTWAGHALFNPKDIPFAVAALFTTSAALRLAMGPAVPSWGATGGAALAAGIALAVRPGGVFVLGYPFLAAGGRALVELARRARAEERLRAGSMLAALSARGLVLIAVAWLVMLSAWPWAQLAPFERPLEAIAVASRFPWEGEVLFDGLRIDARDLPRSYLPVWFAVTLPEIYQVALACALIALARRVIARRWPSAEQSLGLGMIVTSMVVPLAAVLVLRPVLYDAHRHFLFLFPPLAALAGIALADVLGPATRQRWLRGLVGAVLALLALRVGVDMVRLHPYEYVYFNRTFGGLRSARGRFETDYWGASYKEGLAWVLREVPPIGPGRPVRVAACDSHSNRRLRYYIEHWPGASERMRVVRDHTRADVFLALTLDNCHKVPGKVIHRVRRQRVSLLYLIRPERR